MSKKRVFSYTVLDERTSIQKLRLLDQIRAILRELFSDDSKEIRRDDLITQELLKLEANLIDFLDKATDPIRRGHKKSVELKVSSKFKKVLDSVLNGPRYKPYYNINYKIPDIPYDIEYYILVRMEAK